MYATELDLFTIPNATHHCNFLLPIGTGFSGVALANCVYRVKSSGHERQKDKNYKEGNEKKRKERGRKQAHSGKRLTSREITREGERDRDRENELSPLCQHTAWMMLCKS